MKKTFKRVLLIFSLVLGGLLFSQTEKADADTIEPLAWSTWQDAKSFGANCQVRVYTDLLNYYASSSTVDAMAEARNCTSTMYYTMSIVDPDIAWGIIGSPQSGSFTTGTPLKSFNINGVKRQVTTVVQLDLFTNPGANFPTQSIHSSAFTIYPH